MAGRQFRRVRPRVEVGAPVVGDGEPVLGDEQGRVVDAARAVLEIAAGESDAVAPRRGAQRPQRRRVGEEARGLEIRPVAGEQALRQGQEPGTGRRRVRDAAFRRCQPCLQGVGKGRESGNGDGQALGHAPVRDGWSARIAGRPDRAEAIVMNRQDRGHFGNLYLPADHPRRGKPAGIEAQTEYPMPIAHPTPSRPRRRTPLLATVAMLSLLAGGAAMSVATETPPPANAKLAGTVIANAGYADLVAAVKPAVVNVRVERDADAGPMAQGGPMADPEMRRFFERFFGEPGQGPMRGPQQQPHQRERGEGSGFIVSADGLIVTNAHVAGGADKITISLDDGSELPATLKGIDEKTDLALLKVEAGKPLPYVTFGDSAKVRVGDAVVAVGNPFGLGGTVTSGIVSATGREIGSGPYDDFLQIDAPINRGNSGGPTFNLQGEVVGVNSAIFSPSGGSVGIGFAISSNLAKQVVADLQDDGKVERGWLGVQIQNVDEDLAANLDLPTPKGALVSSVQAGTPAASAGVEQGDVILSFDGKPIDQVRQLSRAVAAVEPGKKAEVVVWRDGKEVKLQAEIGRMPAQDQVAAAEQAAPGADQPRLGLALAPITPEQRSELGLDADQQGVLITEVVPGGPAEAKGIQAGDVVLSIDRQPVAQPADVVAAVRKAHESGAKSVLLYIARDGNERFEAVPLATS